LIKFIKMEKITIYYGIQGNGISFGLASKHYKAIKELFPDAQPAKGVFVEYDMRSNFAAYHPQLERYVFPALVGIPNEVDSKKIERIEFILTPEMTLTYTIEQTKKQIQNEPEEQLVFG
jgi:hypothetical protein